MIDINNNIIKEKPNGLIIYSVYDHTKMYVITPFRTPRVFINVHLIINKIEFK